MKKLLSALFYLLFCLHATAQTTAIADTTIYAFAEALPYPLIKSCLQESNPDWTPDSVRRCGEFQFLGLLTSNMRYPEEARQQGIEGTVVLSFVVEPSNGRISNISLLKDIGGGCGEEAIRVLKAMDELGLRWVPAMQGGSPVRLRHALPLRFKLQEALPYYLSEKGDSIYTEYDTEPDFKYGLDSLINYVINRLEYPESWEDSCKTGVFEMGLLIRANGSATVENVLDFNNLGLDFQWEAMRLANRMRNMWTPATYQAKAVTATSPLRVVFKSDAPGCATANSTFDQTMLLADEGARLLSEEKPEEAIETWTKALALQPDNCELLYYRGTALLNQNRREEACQDYNRIKTLLGITWFEQVRRLVCGY